MHNSLTQTHTFSTSLFKISSCHSSSLSLVSLILHISTQVVMASVSKKQSNPIFPLEYMLVSVLFLFMAVIMVLYVPMLFDFFVSAMPLLFTTLKSWFTPPYLYVVVNFIIIAIAASSRFHQKIDEGITTEVAAPVKIQGDANKDYPYDVVRNNSYEYKMDYEAIKPEMYGHFQGKNMGVKTIKKPRELVVKTKKRPVKAKPEFEDMELSKMYGHMETNRADLKTNMEARDLYSKTKIKKAVKPMMDFEVSRPMRYGRAEAKHLPVNNKMETSAMEDEDEYARSKSMEMPIRMNTIEIPMDSSFSEGKGLVSNTFGYQEYGDDERLQAGKEVSATAPEENDTLDDTWKMIMESRRIHDAGLQEASIKAEKYQKGNHLRSPSQSTRK